MAWEIWMPLGQNSTKSATIHPVLRPATLRVQIAVLVAEYFEFYPQHADE